MARHAASDRVNGVFHIHAARSQQFRQFTHAVLSLRDSHPITRDNDYRSDAVEQNSQFFGSDAAHCPSCACLSTYFLLRDLAERAKQDVHSRAIHGSARSEEHTSELQSLTNLV